ncbi:MAG TPA: DUF1772 domain-containing protein [Xanthobacteraceae bacterium]|nr:DUF1772 domain-containing protein [Xanthobacteraceae bacterium]
MALFSLPLQGRRVGDDTLPATAPQEAAPSSRALIEKWGRLHAVRSALGVLAAVLFLAPSLS